MPGVPTKIWKATEDLLLFVSILFVCVVIEMDSENMTIIITTREKIHSITLFIFLIEPHQMVQVFDTQWVDRYVDDRRFKGGPTVLQNPRRSTQPPFIDVSIGNGW